MRLHCGRDALQSTRNILRRCMKDTFAVQFNWKGTKGKLSFSKYKLSEAVISK
jgi:hypothetical protein